MKVILRYLSISLFVISLASCSHTPFPNCLLIGFFTGDDPQYAMGHTNYDEGRLSFEENTLSGSEIRYERMKQIFKEFPEARLGGAT